MTIKANTLEAIEAAAHRMRIDCLRMGLNTGAGGAHFGGGLSMVEIMSVLYMGVLRLNPTRPTWPDRDRFILSKGHGAMAYYAALKQRGIVTDEELLTFKSNNTFLYGHPSMNPDRGIEFSSGSLGLGLALGVGTAMGLLRRGHVSSRVFVLLGDGECNEGSVWESALSAAHFQLPNLIAIVDKNGLQYDGTTDVVLSLGDQAEKWSAFGWEARTVDGHDVEALMRAFMDLPERPTVVIAETVKGKGVSFMEGNPAWHHNRLSQQQFDDIMAELESKP